MSDLNLFNFELQDLAQKILLNDGETSASYHEYAVYTPPVKDRDGPFRSPSIMADSEEALRMFRGAIRDGHGLDDEVSLPTPQSRHAKGTHTPEVLPLGCNEVHWWAPMQARLTCSYPQGEFVEIPPGKPRLLGRVRQL